jgi:ATP-dependent DNA ligase
MKTYIAKDYKISFPKARGEIDDIIYPVYADTKYDGELNFIVKNEVINKDKYGRHRTDFPALNEVLSLNIPSDYVIAGELYYGGNVYDFLRNKENDEVKFAAFDIWQYKETQPNCYIPIDKTPYKDRRLLLESYFANNTFKYAHISECDIVVDRVALNAARLTAINKGYEGLIAKSGASLWLNADLKSWTKLKKEETADLVIMGYSRKAKYLSLLLGYWDNGKLTALCGCGSGLTYNQKIEYAAMLVKDILPPHEQTDKEYILTQPKYVAEVNFQEATILNGKVSALRHPIFMRMRDDKTINDVSWK